MSNVSEFRQEPEDPLDRWRREREEPQLREFKLDTAQLTLDDIDRRIDERVAAEHNFMTDILIELLAQIQSDAEMRGPSGPRGEQGPPGKLPLVKLWTPETVYYEGEVVAYDGGTFQAMRDTGQPPSHAHWICLATAGRDGNNITVRGTFNESADYRRLDVVALNGGSFVALKDKPGPCPGSGWQLLASQGKRGVAGDKGERGPPGPKGDAGARGATIRDWKIDRARYVAVASHERWQRWPAARIARIVRAIFLGGAMTDQRRGERESPRAMSPELVAARITLRVAELRLLAAWTGVLAGRVRPPEAQRRVPRWGGPTSGR